MAFVEWGEFSPKAKRAVRESDARINIREGAVRSGKTVCSILRWSPSWTSSGSTTAGSRAC